jgi:hypothetical protein
VATTRTPASGLPRESRISLSGSPATQTVCAGSGAEEAGAGAGVAVGVAPLDDAVHEEDDGQARSVGEADRPAGVGALDIGDDDDAGIRGETRRGVGRVDQAPVGLEPAGGEGGVDADEVVGTGGGDEDGEHGVGIGRGRGMAR